MDHGPVRDIADRHRRGLLPFLRLRLARLRYFEFGPA